MFSADDEEDASDETEEDSDEDSEDTSDATEEDSDEDSEDASDETEDDSEEDSDEELSSSSKGTHWLFSHTRYLLSLVNL